MDAKTPVQHLTVAPEEAGQKLSRFLERRFPGLPGSLWMRAIRTGQVRLDGKRAKAFDRVAAGQDVRVPPLRLADPASPDAAPAGGLDLHREPDGLLLVRKPAGLPAHPGSGHGDSVQTRLETLFSQAPFTPAPAHRLDKDTSGLLLAATTYQATRTLHDWIGQGRLDKRYLAWVEADLPPGQTLDLSDALAKSGSPGRERVQTGGGKPARAQARCLANRAGRSLLELRLLTGRTHQLRVQLASRGLPITGDPKYGTKRPGPMRLHAWKLVLPDGRIFEWVPDWEGEFRVEAAELVR
ncbi:MAG: RluA family pseudouridine synthase [Thermodesulfobacteriota bacterium]